MFLPVNIGPIRDKYFATSLSTLYSSNLFNTYLLLSMSSFLFFFCTFRLMLPIFKYDSS